MSALESREPPPPTRDVRILCGLTFGACAGVGVAVYRTAVPSSSNQWWYLWPLTVVMSISVASLRGPSILSEILTKSAVEASVRAFLIFAEGIVWSVLGAMVFEGVELGVTRDALGGSLKLALVLPFGPLVGVLAVLYSLWITVPTTIIAGTVLFRCRQRYSGTVDRSRNRATH